MKRTQKWSLAAALALSGLVPAVSYAGQFLYAECQVKSCTWVGVPAANPCGADSLNYGKSTVQVFKYSGTDFEHQHEGLLGVNVMSLNLDERLGNQVYDPIVIKDGTKYLEVRSSAEDQGYRNFRINYSTHTQAVTTGTAEIEFQRPWKQYVKLELTKCKTTL